MLGFFHLSDFMQCFMCVNSQMIYLDFMPIRFLNHGHESLPRVTSLRQHCNCFLQYLIPYFSYVK